MLKVFGRFFRSSMFLYPLLALLYVLSVHYFPDVSVIIKKLNVFICLFFAYNLSSWLLKHNLCKVSSFLASSCFFIYVTHTLVCGNLMKILVYLLRPNSGLGVFFIQVSTVVITVTFLLLVFYLLRCYAPSFLKVTTGRK